MRVVHGNLGRSAAKRLRESLCLSAMVPGTALEPYGWCGIPRVSCNRRVKMDQHRGPINCLGAGVSGNLIVPCTWSPRPAPCQNCAHSFGLAQPQWHAGFTQHGFGVTAEQDTQKAATSTCAEHENCSNLWDGAAGYR